MELDYTIDRDRLSEKFIQEISKIAAASSSEGQSLYDSLLPTLSDSPQLDTALDEAVNNILSRFTDVARSVGTGITFLLPDFIPENESPAKDTLDRYIVNYMLTDWLSRKQSGNATLYSQLAQLSLNNAVLFIKTRDTPKRT